MNSNENPQTTGTKEVKKLRGMEVRLTNCGNNNALARFTANVTIKNNNHLSFRCVGIAVFIANSRLSDDDERAKKNTESSGANCRTTGSKLQKRTPAPTLPAFM